jgi:CRP/FNR family transcriptional regulator, cyclic AMP receptor protein
MIQEIPQADRFKQQLRDSLRHETQNSRAITIAKHDQVYHSGDQDEMVYFIESGQIKLLMLSPEGRECPLAIHAAGDIFGTRGVDPTEDGDQVVSSKLRQLTGDSNAYSDQGAHAFEIVVYKSPSGGTR